MQVTVVDSVSSLVCEFDVPDDDAEFTVGTLKAMIELDMSIPKNEQLLTCGTHTLTAADDSKTMATAGITDGASIQVSRAAADPSSAVALDFLRTLANGMARAPSGPTAEDRRRAEMEADRLLGRAVAEPTVVEGVAVRWPKIGEALKRRDKDAVTSALLEVQREENEARLSQQQRLLRAIQDPLNPESQALLLEQIQQQRIQESYEQATEYLPESFAKVVMLYVPAQVNDVSIAAFVDTGAESTIMSYDTAKRCGIDRFIDIRFAGLALGVGRCKIVGRVHLVKLKLGNRFMQTSLNVLEDNKLDLLLGLELLRRFQCEIDLKANCLRFEGEAVPFLSEGEIAEYKTKFSGESPATAARTTAPLVPEPPISTTRTAPPAVAAAAASTTTTTTAPTAATVDESKIQSLVALGFERTEARNALIRAGGNVELAASLLFQFG